jgi:hypothetical protein
MEVGAERDGVALAEVGALGPSSPGQARGRQARGLHAPGLIRG